MTSRAFGKPKALLCLTLGSFLHGKNRKTESCFQPVIPSGKPLCGVRLFDILKACSDKVTVQKLPIKPGFEMYAFVLWEHA